MPSTKIGWKEVAMEFESKWNFPHCIGAVDGKHIKIKKPSNSGSYYFNYKKTFSIVLIAIVNANYEFMMIDVGANGRASDLAVYESTKFYRYLEQGELNIPRQECLIGTNIEVPYVLVGDDAFTLSPNLMKFYGEVGMTK